MSRVNLRRRSGNRNIYVVVLNVSRNMLVRGIEQTIGCQRQRALMLRTLQNQLSVGSSQIENLVSTFVLRIGIGDTIERADERSGTRPGRDSWAFAS
jgi:hypothetical protein